MLVFLLMEPQGQGTILFPIAEGKLHFIAVALASGRRQDAFIGRAFKKSRGKGGCPEGALGGKKLYDLLFLSQQFIFIIGSVVMAASAKAP